ncbi:MAG TPA: DUF2007 domain-containing protein [Candidatus Kryptobacter bacterium]|nr:DUF2007 domain-containing protein [Candidatus Kryptobacter bacterium]
MTEHIPSNRVKVYSTFVQSDVIFAKMILQQEQIEYFTQNEDVAAVYPIPGMGNVDFFVAESDFERARLVLEPLMKGNEG